MPVWLEIELAMIVVLAPILGWLITKFVSLNTRVSRLEIHKDETKDCLNRIESKIDRLTDKVAELDVRLAKTETKFEG